MSSFVSIGVLSASQFAFCLIGNKILSDYIVQKDSVDKPDPLIKGVFFVSLCTSLTILELLGFEILDIFPRGLRWLIWEICLIIIQIILILIVPFLQIKILFFRKSKTQIPKLLIVVFILYLWCFYKIGSVFPVIDESVSISFFSVEQGISRIGIIGVTLLALISGYGSVSGPATFIFMRRVTSELLDSTERSYKNAQRLLEEKRENFQKVCERNISDKSNDSTINWFLKRVSTAVNMNLSDKEALAEEISNLELVVNNLQKEHESVSYEHQIHEYSKTIHGKLLQIFSHFLTFYCIYRIFSAIVNILFSRIGRADPVTAGIGFFVHIFGVEWDVKLWSKEISFIFVGFIIISSIKNFLSEILKIFKIVDRQEYSKSLVLFSSQLIGLYVTSTILMLRLNLPPANRLLLTEILSAVKFDFFERWFDAIFIFSAVASAAFLYHEKLNKY